MQRGESCTLILQIIGSVFCVTRCGPCTGQTTSHINQNAGISAYLKLERCRNFHIHPTRENGDDAAQSQISNWRVTDCTHVEIDVSESGGRSTSRRSHESAPRCAERHGGSNPAPSISFLPSENHLFRVTSTTLRTDLGQALECNFPRCKCPVERALRP